MLVLQDPCRITSTMATPGSISTFFCGYEGSWLDGSPMGELTDPLLSLVMGMDHSFFTSALPGYDQASYGQNVNRLLAASKWRPNASLLGMDVAPSSTDLWNR